MRLLPMSLLEVLEGEWVLGCFVIFWDEVAKRCFGGLPQNGVVLCHTFFWQRIVFGFPWRQRLKRTWKWVESGGRFFLAGLKYDSEALLGYEKMKNGIGLLRGRSGTVDTHCHWLLRKIRNLPIRSMKASNPWPNLSSRKGDLVVPFRRNPWYLRSFWI